MARVKAWFNNNGQQVNFPGWAPYVVALGIDVPTGTTLLRTRIDVDISNYSRSDSSLPASYPWANAGWQTAVAVCWSASGPPASYYSEVFADWIFVQQVSFDLQPYSLHIDAAPQDNVYMRNTIESRQVDSHSQRLATVDHSELYLVVDSIDYGSTDSSQWEPTIQWTSRVLVEQPA